MKCQQGYTLIELMLIGTVLSILGVIALATYLNYSVRAQVAEGLALMPELRTAVEEYYLQYGVWPSDNNRAGLGNPTDYVGNWVEGISVSKDGNDGFITIDYGLVKLGGNDKLSFKGIATNGSFSWECDTTRPNSVDVIYLPGECR